MKRKSSKVERVVLVCVGSDCKKAGSKKLVKKTSAYLEKLGLAGTSKVVGTKCSNLCKHAPVVCLRPDNVWLTGATKSKVKKAVRRCFG